MSDIGVEVGQKMRLAIKAKLSELKCYVDDELPDYIMVMIANKRTKTQMKDDLSLFLRNETSSFVEWLHIVLKKLKQVHVTNPNVFKNSSKRKSNEYVASQDASKKIKKEDAKIKREKHLASDLTSLTDDLPINARSLSEAGKRKIVLIEDTSAVDRNAQDDDFDIPLLSEMNTSIEQLQAHDDDCDEYLSIKPDPIDMDFADQTPRTPPIRQTSPVVASSESLKKPIHARIIFNKDEDSLRSKYDSILGRSRDDPKFKPRSIRDRLGKRVIKENKPTGHKLNNSNQVDVQSEVTIPPKRNLHDNSKHERPKDEETSKPDVASVIKVKPRTLPPKATHANVSLLFKAVAEAQRSIRQTETEKKQTSKPVENPPALFTKRYREKEFAKSKETSLISSQLKGRLGEQNLKGIKTILVPKEVVESKEEEEEEALEVKSVSPEEEEADDIGKKQQFIVTLDGIDKSKYSHIEKTTDEEDVVKMRKTPSPIIFTAENVPIKEKVIVPALQFTSKANGICKYYPNCIHGKRCDYVHPIACKKFPNCKFGEKCAYDHPICKFESSCTRKSCPFRHNRSPVVALPITGTTAICKFHPNCTNEKCAFLHVKACKFGAYCKNAACTYYHSKHV